MHFGDSVVICEALVRVYREGERRSHPGHFDLDALATAVVELNEDFSGGFFIQPGAHVDTQTLLPLSPGDVGLHSFDLQVLTYTMLLCPHRVGAAWCECNTR